MNSNNIVYLLAGLIAVLGLVSLIGPVRQNNQKFEDQQISQDFETISTAVQGFFSDEGFIPDNIDDLVEELNLDEDVIERINRAGYEYSLLASKYPGDTNFQLCAVFKTDTLKNNPDSSIFSSFTNSADTNSHASGRVCFEFTTDSFGSNFDDYSETLDSFIDGFPTDIPIDFDDLNLETL